MAVGPTAQRWLAGGAVHWSLRRTASQSPLRCRQFCHCRERNFDYLNWSCTRNCGAGRPHVGLCPALLIVCGPKFIGHFCMERGRNRYRSHFFHNLDFWSRSGDIRDQGRRIVDLDLMTSLMTSSLSRQLGYSEDIVGMHCQEFKK